MIETEYYVVTRDGVFLGLFLEAPYEFNIPNVSIHKFIGFLPDLNWQTWDPNTDTFVGSVRILSKLAFLNLFTPAERIAARTSSDPAVIDIMAQLEIADHVNLDDVNTQNALLYLTYVGILAAGRKEEVLA